MTYVFVIEQKPRSPNYGKEVACPVTVIDVPPMIIAAVKAYTKDGNGLRTFTVAWADSLPEGFERIKGLPKEPKPDESFKRIQESLTEIAEFRVIAATQPRLTSVPKKKPDIMEVKIGGGTKEEQLAYAQNLLGRTVAVGMSTLTAALSSLSAVTAPSFIWLVPTALFASTDPSEDSWFEPIPLLGTFKYPPEESTSIVEPSAVWLAPVRNVARFAMSCNLVAVT